MGGTGGSGTVFKITASGTLMTLNSFPGKCAYPYAALIQATDGNFYGTTWAGTIFRITPDGTLGTLDTFDGSDGANPYAPLIQATDGNLYGTTNEGGLGVGTVFRVTLSGRLTTIYSFSDANGGASQPTAALVQDTNGSFYGTTYYGGVIGAGVGTVFGLSVGLGPFVETQPSSGRVESAVRILGTNLTGATSVTFNGTAATFTVQSATAIKTTVPAGATTGPVQVVTPSGTLASNVNFRVE
ncbi:MAG TPA: choice-of-anchor tandem repeat GloVer-containing protein [Terriglobia bacterium]|nr:choice-of-anchor tandem repeat GloVer-containing protein [Terriglobia bacterium]